jgi:DHA1 family tetracycline resistance protein-like MFS transporter
MTAGSGTKSQPVSLLPVFLIVLVDVFGMTLVIPLLAIYAETFHRDAAAGDDARVGIRGVPAGIGADHRPDVRPRRPQADADHQPDRHLHRLHRHGAGTCVVDAVHRARPRRSTAGNLSLAQAYISDHTEPDQRAKSFGLIGIAFGVGFSSGRR